MSYDLQFYKRKNKVLTESNIEKYLSENLSASNKNGYQWFAENEDIEAYFIIEKYETDQEKIEYFENFEEFDYAGFNFNLNYLRPDFFGQYAFRFVDKFIKELDLFVLNPQSSIEPEKPIKPKANELYKNWSEINSRNSIEFSKKHQLEYFPLEKSNYYYRYNEAKARLQEKFGDNYYVPKLYLFKKKEDGKIITLSTWTQHIPNIFPSADYFLISKKFKRIFRTVEENGIISSERLFERFGNLMDDLDFENCKIIYPTNAEKAKDLFNSTKIEYKLEGFGERIPIEKIVNYKVNQ